MRITREQAASNRKQVLAAATEQFREFGFDGVAVADLMSGAGLDTAQYSGKFSDYKLLAGASTAATSTLTDNRPLTPGPSTDGVDSLSNVERLQFSGERLALDLLRAEKILVTHGRGFNWPDPDHLRIVTLPGVEVLEDAITRFGDFLSTYRQ